MVKPHRAPRNSGGAKPFSPITKSDSDSSGLLKKLGASKANDVRKSVKPSNRSLRIDSDDEVTDGNDVKLQQAPSCDEGLDTIEVQSRHLTEVAAQNARAQHENQARQRKPRMQAYKQGADNYPMDDDW